MTRPEFQTLLEEIRADQDKLLTKKGADYTQQSDDVHHNFKIVAEQLGLTPLQVWAVYAAKHWLAIMTYIKHGALASEPIESRFRDLGNYLLLGEGLLIGSQVHDHESGLTKTAHCFHGRECCAHGTEDCLGLVMGEVAARR